jgi:Short C-terminal domain/Bacterial PH domain
MGWLVKSRLSDKKRQQLIDDAQQALLPGEHILDVTGGLVDVHRFGGNQARRGTLAVTDKRVFLQTKRAGGFDVQDFAYGLLSGCNYATGAGFSTIELVSPGDSTRVSQILKDEGARIGPLIRNQMAVAQSTTAGPAAAGAPQPTDAADQLRKLSQLRDDGLLSEEEFQAKRDEVVKRL